MIEQDTFIAQVFLRKHLRNTLHIYLSIGCSQYQAQGKDSFTIMKFNLLTGSVLSFTSIVLKVLILNILFSVFRRIIQGFGSIAIIRRLIIIFAGVNILYND